jgi:type I restriction enzyme R subunit
MYVDKTLAGIKAVQTLSRLNRAHPDKTNTFVLDFMNTADTIRDAFKDYYRTTVLAEETDPDKLHDMKASLDHRQVYSQDQVDQVMENLLHGNSRAVLDPILDPCIAPYLALDEDGQVDFKATAKAFVRLYAFLSQVLPYANPEWERLFTFLNLLIPRLPAPEEEDLSKGILEAVDIESYRAERQETIQIALADENAEIQPVPTGGGGSLSEPDMDPLSKIIADFNLLWGDNFTDPDRVVDMINSMPDQVATDTAYQNAKRNSDAQNARIEHDAALMRLVTAMLRCNTELYRQYTENPEFKAWLSSKIFEATYGLAAQHTNADDIS